jgi:hypothetical protein
MRVRRRADWDPAPGAPGGALRALFWCAKKKKQVAVLALLAAPRARVAR